MTNVKEKTTQKLYTFMAPDGKDHKPYSRRERFVGVDPARRPSVATL